MIKGFKIKKFVIGTFLLLLILSLVGCNTSSSGSNSNKTVEVWLTPMIETEELKKLESEFNETHEDVQVKFTILNWSDGREKIKAALSNGTGPDVFYIGVGLDQDYIDANIFASSESLGFTQEELDRYLPLIEANKVDNQIYAFPLGYETNLLFYRKDILQQYGFNEAPATWDELYHIAETISTATMKNGKPEIMGLQVKGMDDHLNAINQSWISMFHAAGGEFLKDDQSTLHSKAGIDALTYLRSFYENNVSIPGPSSVNGFTTGEVAMFFFTQPTADQQSWYQNPEMKDKWAMAPMPKGPVSSASFFSGPSIAGNANSDNLENAGVFIRWITSPEVIDVFMKNGHFVPPYDLTTLSTEIQDEYAAIMNEDKEVWDAISTQIEHNIDGNAADLVVQGRKGYTDRWNAQKSHIVSALAGESSIDSALEQIDLQINQALR